MISKLLNWELYQQWKRRRKGLPIVDKEKGAGYYFLVGFIGVKMKGKEELWDMKSGKKMRVKLLDYKLYNDPDDMIESSQWQYLGYLGEKLFVDMTWKEYLNLHEGYNRGAKEAL